MANYVCMYVTLVDRRFNMYIRNIFLFWRFFYFCEIFSPWTMKIALTWRLRSLIFINFLRFFTTVLPQWNHISLFYFHMETVNPFAFFTYVSNPANTFVVWKHFLYESFVNLKMFCLQILENLCTTKCMHMYLVIVYQT